MHPITNTSEHYTAERLSLELTEFTCSEGRQNMHYFVIISSIYTECPRRNVPDFGRVFLMLKYTDITQNTYVQSGTVTDIMAREV